jgi:hypothetical protein
MIQWFVYSILIGILAAHHRTCTWPDAHYLWSSVPHATAFIAYAMGGWQNYQATPMVHNTQEHLRCIAVRAGDRRNVWLARRADERYSYPF